MRDFYTDCCLLPFVRWRARVLRGGVQRLMRLRVAHLAGEREALFIQRSSSCDISEGELPSVVGRLQQACDYVWQEARALADVRMPGRHHLLSVHKEGLQLPAKLALLARWAGRLWKLRVRIEVLKRGGRVTRPTAIGSVDSMTDRIVTVALEKEAKVVLWTGGSCELWTRVCTLLLLRETVAARRAFDEAGSLSGVLRDLASAVTDQRRQRKLEKRNAETAAARFMMHWMKHGSTKGSARSTSRCTSLLPAVSAAHTRRVARRSKVVAWMNGVTKKRRLDKLRSLRVAKERREAVVAGREAGRGGLWRVAAILAVKRPPGRGRRLKVRVRWVGRGGRDDWVNVTQLNEEAKREARRMEASLYGLPPLPQERPAPSRVQPKRGLGDMEGDEAEVLIRPHRRMKSRRVVVGDEDSESRTMRERLHGVLRAGVSGAAAGTWSSRMVTTMSESI